MRRRALAFFLLTWLFVPPLAAQWTEGLRAPPNRWHVAGGSGARSRNTTTRLGVRLGQAWTANSEFGFVGEPLVWDDEAVVLERLKGDDVSILQVDLATGQVRARTRKIGCGREPEIAIWSRRVLLAAPGEGLLGFLRARTTINQRWRVPIAGDVGSPILIKDRVWFRQGTNIVHFVWGRREPVWTCAGAYVGRFALVGGEILALNQVAGSLRLDVIDAEKGIVTSSESIGPVNTQFATYDPLVQVGPAQVLVTLPGIALALGGGGNGVVLERQVQDGKTRLKVLGDIKLLGPALMKSETILFRGEMPGAGEAWCASGKEGYDAITLKAEREDLFRPGLSPTQAGGCIWLGDLAFEPRQGRIRRRSEVSDAVTAVPARSMILFLSGDRKRIEAWREPLAAPPVPKAAIAVASGRAVLADGDVLVGRFEIAAGGDRLASFDAKDRKKEHPLGEVLFLEDDAGRLHHHASEDNLLRGLDILDDAALGEIAYEAARAARGARSAEHLARFLDEAGELGVDEKRLASLDKALEELEKKPRHPDEKKVAALEEEHRQGLAAIAARDWRRIEALPGDDHELRVALLRRLFDRAPDHEAAREMIRTAIPEEIRPKGDFDASSWLDFLLATRRRPIRIVIPPEKGRKSEADALQRDVGAARHTWRPDVIGVASEQLLVLTPPGNPSQLANCLTVGEMVGEELERMFGGVRDSRFPLRIHLFPTRKDYVEFHRRRQQQVIGEFSLGNYSPTENVSRLFVPDDADALNDMLSTFVHELTHHWVSVRCPVVKGGGSRRIRSRGFWVVEGLATMMEEFVYDPRRGTIETDHPAIDSLDTIANCPDGSLLPWQNVLLSTQTQFAKLMIDPRPIPGLSVPMTWQIGFRRAPSGMNLFYAQAGAVCHYLLSAEGGRLRQKLIDMVAAYYNDEAADWTPEAFLGADADTLGEKVRAYARKRVSP